MSTARVDTITNSAGTGAVNFSKGYTSNSSGGFSAHKSSNQTIPTAVNTLVTFSLERFDTNSTFASNRFTVPSGADGLYIVSASIGWSQTGAGQRVIDVIKNGVDSSATKVSGLREGNASFITTNTVVSVWNLVAGDYLEVFGYQSSGGNLDITGNENQSFFTVVKAPG